MRKKMRLLLLVPVLLAAGPALTAPPDDEMERNLALLERFRADPDHYTRLRRDLKTFSALPADRQDRLRKLDEDLYGLDSAEHERLWVVLERYQSWFERLPETDRQEVLAAEGPKRLEVIRQIR